MKVKGTNGRLTYYTGDYRCPIAVSTGPLTPPPASAKRVGIADMMVFTIVSGYELLLPVPVLEAPIENGEPSPRIEQPLGFYVKHQMFDCALFTIYRNRIIMKWPFSMGPTSRIAIKAAYQAHMPALMDNLWRFGFTGRIENVH